MSVLPSFKSVFSSFAEAEPTGNIRIADDSGLLTQSTNRVSASSSIVAHQSPFLDHIPVESQAQNRASWSPLDTNSAENTTFRHQKVPEPELSSRQVTNSLPRPAVAPLPLDLLPDGAPSFYFNNRPLKRATSDSSLGQRFIEPLPQGSLGITTEPRAGIRQESLKRAHSPSVHAGAYKRPRSQSISAGGSYVKLPSQCSSERHPDQYSPSDHRAHRVITVRVKKSRSDRLSSAILPVKVSEGTSLKEETNSTRHLSSSTLTIQGGGRKLGRATSTGPVLLKPSSVSPGLSDAARQFPDGVRAHNGGVVSYRQNVRKVGNCGDGSQGVQISPNTSSARLGNDESNCNMLRGGGMKTVNLVTPAAPGFSYRDAGSRAGVHGYNTRILAEDDILEDSSSRDANDVLGSPRQPSLSSLGIGRRLRGGLIPGLTVSQGPTVSDLSLFLGESRDNVSQRKARVVIERSDGSARGIEVASGRKNDTEGDGKEKEPSRHMRAVSERKGCKGDVHSRECRELRRRVVNGAEHCSTGRRTEETGMTSWRESEEWGEAKCEEIEDSVDGLRGHEAWRQRPKVRLQRMGGRGGLCGEDGMRGRYSASGQNYVDYETGEETFGVGDWGGGSSGDLEVEAEGNRKTEVYEGGNEKNRDRGGAEGLNVKCPHCPRRLRNAVTLQNHVRVVHDHSGKYRCGQCGLTFMWRSTLGNHVRLVHEKQRPYACEECAKAFRWNSHLREHYWVVHKGEKPFRCETCGKTFGRKNNMQKHMRKHSKTTSS